MSGSDVYRPPMFSAPIDLDLSKNEGRPGPAARAALNAGTEDRVSRYPDTSLLRRTLADRFGVEIDRVLVTAGGDDALFRCFLSTAGGQVVATNPSFEMIRLYAGQTGSTLEEVEWWDGDFPTAEFLLAGENGGDLGLIVSPNNPTGSVATGEDLARVAAGFDLVVLDAAYTEFADEDLTAVALELDNVVTVRTMSKAFGLAGLRVGCLIGAPRAIERIAAFGNPYPVSAVSAGIAVEALTDLVAMEDYVDRVRTERKELTDFLDSAGARPLPSQANFVLARFVNADWVTAVAASLGVGLRVFPDRPDLDGFVRISLPGDDSDFQRLVSSLERALDPEAIIFDLDGVIADVSGSYRAAIVETAASFGVEVTSEMIGTAKAAGNANDDWDLTRRLCFAAGADVPLQMVKDRFERLYQGDGSDPGLKSEERPLLDRDTLADLARRLPLGIVTGRPSADAYEFLDRFDLGGFFSAVVTREEAPMKPDPGPIRLALARLGVDRAWLVGDTRDDLLAARAAGVVPIGVVAPGDDPARSQDALSDAALVLRTTAQIMEVLDGQDV
jgi:histidinol-phosphate aminotransferase